MFIYEYVRTYTIIKLNLKVYLSQKLKYVKKIV